MSKEYYMELASRGAIDETQLMEYMRVEYAMSPSNFTMEEVDYLEKYNQQVNQAFQRNIESEDNKITAGVNQFISGVVEGFTTLGWADEPDTQGQALANKIGHFIGFAPDIIAGVVTGGMSASITAAKLGGKLGTKHMSKAAKKKLGSSIAKRQAQNQNLQEKIGQIQQTAGAWGKKRVPFLVTEGEGGSLALRSVPMRAADFILKQSKEKMGGVGMDAAKFFGKHSDIASDILIDKGVHLGVALGVSSIWEGPKAASEAAVHGTIAGIVFGGVGNYMNFGKALASGDKFVRAGAESVLRQKAAKISREGGEALDFLVKGTAGASYTGYMAKDAPLPDQVYELMLGFFFGASSRPWAEIQRTRLVNKHNDELMTAMDPYLQVDPKTGKPVWNEKSGKAELKEVEKAELSELSKPDVELDKLQKDRKAELQEKQTEFDRRNELNAENIGVLPIDITTFDFYKEAHPKVQKELELYEGRILQQVYERNLTQWDKILKGLEERAKDDPILAKELKDMDWAAKLIKIRNQFVAEQQRINKNELVDGAVLEPGSIKQTVDKDGNYDFSYIGGGQKYNKAAIEQSKDTLFVFSDNLKGDAVSNSATEARGLDNSIPIRANKSKTEVWSDKNLKDNKKIIDEDIAAIIKKMTEGNYEKLAVMDTPFELSKNAPKTAKYLAKKLGALRKNHGFKGIKVYSGGRRGADSIFDKVLSDYNIKVTHFYSKDGKKPIKGNTELTKDELLAADASLAKANKTLDRDINELNESELDNIRKDWHQIKDSDQIIALGEIVNNQIAGETAWAVQMAIDAGGKQVLVYDVIRKKWNEWNNERGVFEERASIPTLSRNYTGIGSRKVGQEDFNGQKLTESWKLSGEVIKELIEYNYGSIRNPYPELIDQLVTKRKIDNNKSHDNQQEGQGREPYTEKDNGEEYDSSNPGREVMHWLDSNAKEVKGQVTKVLRRVAFQSLNKKEFLDKVKPILAEQGIVDNIDTMLIKYFNHHGNSMAENTMAISVTLKQNKDGYWNWGEVDVISTPETNREGKRIKENRPENVTNLEYGEKVAFYIDTIDMKGENRYYRQDFGDIDANASGARAFTPYNIEFINKALRNKEWLKTTFPNDIDKNGESILSGAYIFALPKDKTSFEIRKYPFQSIDQNRGDYISGFEFKKIKEAMMSTYRANGGNVLTAAPFFNNIRNTMFGSYANVKTSANINQTYSQFFSNRWSGRNTTNIKNLEDQIMSNMLYELIEHGYINRNYNGLKPKDFAEALNAYMENPPIKDIMGWNKYRGLFRGNGRQLNNEELLSFLKKDKLNAVVIEDMSMADKQFLAEQMGKMGEENALSLIAQTDGAIMATSKIMDFIGTDTGIKGRSSAKPFLLKYGDPDLGIGLILGKAGLFRGTPELNDFMESNGIDFLIRKSALKGDSKLNVGKLEFKNGEYSLPIEGQPFDLMPSNIRIIDSEIERGRKDGTKNIRTHKGIWNKPKFNFPKDFDAAWNRLIQSQINPDPDFNKLIDPETYTSKSNYNDIDKLVDSPNRINSKNLDRLSIDKIQDVVNNNSHTELMSDIVRSVLNYGDGKLDLATSFDRSVIPDYELPHKKLVMDVLEAIDYNPIYLQQGDVKAYVERAIKNYLFARIQRPISKYGVDFTRAHGGEEIFNVTLPELQTDKSNGKFYLNNGHAKDPFLQRFKDGTTKEITLGRAFDLYNGIALNSKSEPIKLGAEAKQLLFEDLHYLFTRAPQASNSGSQTLLFGGFTGVEGRGYIANAKVYRDLNGMDVDIDAVSGYQSLEWAIKDGFRTPEIANELVGKKLMDLDTYDTGKSSADFRLDTLLAQRFKITDSINQFELKSQSFNNYKGARAATIFHPWWRLEQGKESQTGKKNIGIITDNTTFLSTLAHEIQNNGPKRYNLLEPTNETKDILIELREPGDIFENSAPPSVENMLRRKESMLKQGKNVMDFLSEAGQSAIASSVDAPKNWINRNAGGFISDLFHATFKLTRNGVELIPGEIGTIPYSYSSLLGNKGKENASIPRIHSLIKNDAKNPTNESYRKVSKEGESLRQQADYNTFVEKYNPLNTSDLVEFKNFIKEIVKVPANLRNELDVKHNIMFANDILGKSLDSNYGRDVKSNDFLDNFYSELGIKVEFEKGKNDILFLKERNKEFYVLEYKDDMITLGYLDKGKYQQSEMFTIKVKPEDILQIQTDVEPMHTMRAMRDFNSSMSQKFDKISHTASSMDWNAANFKAAWNDHTNQTNWYSKQADIVSGKDGFKVEIDLLNSMNTLAEKTLIDAVEQYQQHIKENSFYKELIENGWFKEHPLLAGLIDKTRPTEEILSNIYNSEVLTNKEIFRSVDDIVSHISSVMQLSSGRDKLVEILSKAGIEGDLIQNKIGEALEVAWELQYENQIRRKIQAETGSDVNDKRLNSKIEDYKNNRLDNFYYDKNGKKIEDKKRGLTLFNFIDRGAEEVEFYDSTAGTTKPVTTRTADRSKIVRQELIDIPEVYDAIETMFDMALLSTHIGGNKHRNKLNHSLLYEYLHKDIKIDEFGRVDASEIRRRERSLETEIAPRLGDESFRAAKKLVDKSQIPLEDNIVNSLKRIQKAFDEEGLQGVARIRDSKGEKTARSILNWTETITQRGGEPIERLESINPKNLKLYFDNKIDFWKEITQRNLKDQILDEIPGDNQNPNNLVSNDIILEQLKNKYSIEKDRTNPKSKEEPILLQKQVSFVDVDKNPRSALYLTRSNGEQSKLAVIRQNNTTNKSEIVFSKKAIDESFAKKSWKNPATSGVKPLPIDFSNKKQWREFVLYHELSHFLNKKRIDESTVEYENRTNRIALKTLEYIGSLSKKQLEILELENFMDWKNKSITEFNILQQTNPGELTLEYDPRQNTSNAETLVRIRDIDLAQKTLDDIILSSIVKEIRKPDYKKNNKYQVITEEMIERGSREQAQEYEIVEEIGQSEYLKKLRVGVEEQDPIKVLEEIKKVESELPIEAPQILDKDIDKIVKPLEKATTTEEVTVVKNEITQTKENVIKDLEIQRKELEVEEAKLSVKEKKDKINHIRNMDRLRSKLETQLDKAEKKNDEIIIDSPPLKEPDIKIEEKITPKEAPKIELEEEVVKPPRIDVNTEAEKREVIKKKKKIDLSKDTHKSFELIKEMLEKMAEQQIKGEQPDTQSMEEMAEALKVEKDRLFTEGHSHKIYDVTPETLEKYVDMANEKGIEYASGKYKEELVRSEDVLAQMEASIKKSVVDELQPMQDILTMDDVSREAGKMNIDKNSPDYYTPLMKARLEELLDLLQSNPKLIQDFQHEFTAVSAELGTQGKLLLGKAFKDMDAQDVKWFSRYLKDAYDPSLGLISKIKLYANIMNKNFNDPDLGTETAEEALRKFKGVKGIYHVMFTRTIGESILKRHELRRFEEKNQAVAKEGPNGIPALKSIIRPTSTLELIRDYVDFGKTNNTAATAMFKELYTASFDFLQTQDKNLATELNNMFENAVRLREFKNVELKVDGLSPEAVEWYTANKELADIYFKSLEGKTFEIKDPDSTSGQTFNKTGLEIAEMINKRLTNYLKEISDTFITKGMDQIKDVYGDKVTGYKLSNEFMNEVIGMDGWLSKTSMSNLLSKQKLQSGKDMNQQLKKAPGLNQLNFLQYHYNLLIQAETLFGKDFKKDPEAINWRDTEIELREPKTIELIEDASGLPSFYFPHNGMWDISGNQQAVSKTLRRNMMKYEESLLAKTTRLPSEIDVMYKKKAEGFYPFEKAVEKAVEQKKRKYTEARMLGQSPDGTTSISNFQNIAYSKTKGPIGQYQSGSLNARAEDFLPYYRIDKRAIDVYTNNTVKNYFDMLIGLKSQMLLDSFEKRNALGEHTENWSGFIRDSLINMLGYNTFREIGIAGITAKEHGFLTKIVANGEHVTDSVVRKILGRIPGVAEKRFLQQVDDYVAPPIEWIQGLPSTVKGKALTEAINDYKMEKMAELADPKNINKIKRYGTVYNYFSEEGVANRLEWMEEKLGAKFFKNKLSRIDHEGNRVDMVGNERRNMMGNIAKNFSNLEGKYQLLSLLAHPKTLITNIYGGSQNTFADNGWEIFRQATKESFLVEKVFNNAEFDYRNPATGKMEKISIRSMEDIHKWVDSLGILDSMFLQEVGINKDLNRRDSKAFWKEFWTRFTNKLEKEPNKESQETYERLHKATLMELASEKGLADNIISKGAGFMQWSERLLRRTSFLASYIQARRNLQPLTKELPFDSPVLIQFAKKGVEASQFMYHSAFRTNYSNTALGRVMTRFHPYAWNSISRRLKIYKGAQYVSWAENVGATQKAQRQMTADLMAFALGTVFTSSIFEYALSPPMNWMQDSAQLLFGDKEARERAFFSQWPHPVLAPLTVVTPPISRFVLQPVQAILNDDLNSLATYGYATWLPFGRLGRDVYRTVQSPAMAVDFLTGIPLHRIHSKRRDFVERLKEENQPIEE